MNYSVIQNLSEIKIGQKLDKILDLGMNLLTFIFEFLDQKEYFLSVSQVNKKFYSICKIHQKNLSYAEIKWKINLSLIKYCERTFDHICNLTRLTKLKIKQEKYPNESKINIISTPQAIILSILKNCQWSRSILSLEIYTSQINSEVSIFLNSLVSLRILKIRTDHLTQIQIAYLFKKFIIPEYLLSEKPELDQFGEIVFHPLEKFYLNPKISNKLTMTWLIESLNYNESLTVFEFKSLNWGGLINIHNNAHLRKFSIQDMHLVKMESLVIFILKNINLEHLHLSIDFRESCELLALAILNHPRLRCLKIFNRKIDVSSASFFSNYSDFLKVISKSRLSKIEIFFLNDLKFQDCFRHFLWDLPDLTILKIKINDPYYLAEDFIYDCFRVPLLEKFNKIKKSALMPNELGRLKICPMNTCKEIMIKDILYSMLICDIIFEVQNLKRIEYPNHSVEIDQFSQHFSTSHEFFSDKLEDLYYLNKDKYTIYFKEAHFNVTTNILFNNFLFFKLLSNCFECFSCLTVLKISINFRRSYLFHFQKFYKIFLSIPTLEEFYLGSIKRTKFDLNIESYLKLKLQKFTINNHYFYLDPIHENLVIIPNNSLTYLNLSNSKFDETSYECLLKLLKNNQLILSLILNNIKINRDQLKTVIPEFSLLLDVLLIKKQMQDVEITFDYKFYHEDYLELKALGIKYLNFLEIYFENNPNLKSFNVFLLLTKNFLQRFVEIIVKYCIENKKIILLFTKSLFESRLESKNFEKLIIDYLYEFAKVISEKFFRNC